MQEHNPANLPDLLNTLAGVPDPRTRACPHPWDELMLTALCGVPSGADGWVSVVDWAKLKLPWLRGYLPFANCIASHDTFSRVFSLLDAVHFEAFFIDWKQGLCPQLAGQIIPLMAKVFAVRRTAPPG